MHFDASEENKLIYTEIFQKYHETIEAYIIEVTHHALSYLNNILIEIE